MRNALPLAVLAAGLVACTGSFNQGAEPGDSGTSSDGADGGGGGGTTDGADGGGGTDGTGSTQCTHSYEPVHKTGWRKDFQVTFSGNTGSAFMEGLGQTGGTEGAEIYSYRDSLTTGTDFDVIQEIGCNTNGEGMYVLGWGGTFNISVIDGLPIPIGGTMAADFNPGRQYLPADYALEGTASWSYSYTSSLTYQMDGDTGLSSGTATFSGTYSAIGFETISLGTGESVDAFKIANEYTSTTDVAGAPFPAAGYIEQWYVKGLGLVKEISYDNADTSTPLMTRELSNYTGLVIE